MSAQADEFEKVMKALSRGDWREALSIYCELGKQVANRRMAAVKPDAIEELWKAQEQISQMNQLSKLETKLQDFEAKQAAPKIN